MEYILSKKYDTPELQALIMGPNPVKLEEELLRGSRIPAGAVVCDLGSGTGLTSVFMAKEYGFTVYAADLWSDPDENRRFFRRMGLSDGQVIPVKADATAMPFEREFFDAVVSTDSYNYFGRDPEYLDAKLAPFVKSGGYIYIALTGMKKDCHDALPACLLASWDAEQLEYLHDLAWWREMIGQTSGVVIEDMHQMACTSEAWADWIACDNEYAQGDRAAVEAGALEFLNTIAVTLVKA